MINRSLIVLALAGVLVIHTSCDTNQRLLEQVRSTEFSTAAEVEAFAVQHNILYTIAGTPDNPAWVAVRASQQPVVDELCAKYRVQLAALRTQQQEALRKEVNALISNAPAQGQEEYAEKLKRLRERSKGDDITASIDKELERVEPMVTADRVSQGLVACAEKLRGPRELIKNDPLLGSAYIFSWDNVYAYNDPGDAWRMFGTDGVAGGVSETEFEVDARRTAAGLVHSWSLPNHTLVEVLAESADGHESIIKIKVLAGQTIEDVRDGKDVDSRGVVLFAWSDDVVRKGTYKTTEERLAAEAAEEAAGAAWEAECSARDWSSPPPPPAPRFPRK